MIVQLAGKSTSTRFHWLPAVTQNSEGETKRTSRHKTPAQEHDNAIASTAKTQTFNQPTGPTCHSCDELIVNERTIDIRLSWIRRCLTHLLFDEDLDCNNTDDVDREQLVSTNYQSQFAWRKFDHHRMRLKKMIDIYTIILRRLPSFIEGSPMAGRPNESRACHRVDLLDARQQVLNLIEQLGGYCDSIDLLRCILKSPQTIGVIYAYDVITKKLNSQGSTNRHLRHSQTDVSKEFRVIQEWRI